MTRNFKIFVVMVVLTAMVSVFPNTFASAASSTDATSAIEDILARVQNA